jgi:hypothetical protein
MKPKKKTRPRRVSKKPLNPPLDPLRAGMPAQDSITGVDQYGSGKKVLRIIHTTECDAYDEVPAKGTQKKD